MKEQLKAIGEQADRARDILWQMPRESKPPERLNRRRTCGTAGRPSG